MNKKSSAGQRSVHQNRTDLIGSQVLEGKGDSIMDGGKEMLLSDGRIKEVPGLKLGDHRSCRQGVGLF